MTSLPAKPLIYTERTDDDAFEPTEEDIAEFAKRIGIDISAEPELLSLAREGLRAPLPEGWKPCRQRTRDRDVWFYYNLETHQSQWEHPMDPIYREKVIQARSELAMNKIKSFDPLKMRPPKKSLPPLKRTGGLAPLNSAVGSLGKLGGFGPAAGDLRDTAPNSNASISNNLHHPMNNKNNNSNPLGRLPNNSDSNIISGSSLNSFKDTDDDDDDSVRFMKPQRKLGLTLTGGGANFIKGSEGLTKNKGGLAASSSLDYSEGTHDSDFGAAEDPDKKPIKSILVNSISRSRPTNPSDKVYELDGFSMNLDEMTDEEKLVVSQLESTTTSRSKGNVKFNLDENTELKFEMSGDENEEPQNDDDTEEEEEEESVENDRNTPTGEIRGSGVVLHSGGDIVNRDNSNISSGIKMGKNETTFIPEYSEEEIAAMKKAMRNEMEEELRKFKDQLEEERKTRQEQIQKHLEQTVTLVKIEKEETIKRIRKDMESEKALEVDKAKREIDSLLQIELEDMKTKFENALQTRQMELEEEKRTRQDQIQKHLEETLAQFKMEKEETIQRIRKEMENEKTLEVDKAKREIDSLLRNELEEMKMKFDNALQTRQMELEDENQKGNQKRLFMHFLNVMYNSNTSGDIKNSGDGVDRDNIIASLGDKMGKNEMSFIPDYFEEEIAAMKKAMREEMEEELRKFKEQLEEERKTRQEEIKKHLEDTLAQFELEKENAIKKMRKDMESKKAIEVDKAKREIDTLLENEIKDMKAKFNNTLQTKRKELIDEHQKKIEKLATELRKTENEKVSEVLKQQATEDQKTVDDVKAFIRMQKNRSKHSSPVPNSSHLILPATKNNLLLFDEKLLKAVSPRRPASIHLDLVSETESSGVSSLKDHKSSENNIFCDNALQARRKELEDEHQKKLEMLTAEFRKNEDEKMAEVLKQQATEDTHQRIVEDAKAFIRRQKNRLKDPSPIPNSSHLILPATKNNLLLFDEKLLKSVSPRRPASIHLDLVSETESSSVSSLKDHRSSESKKLSKDIDEICNSLISLDQQMKLMWSVVKDRQQQPYYHHHNQDEQPLFNTNSSTNFSALLPNTMPILLGKSTRVCASLPTSARKPLVPPSTAVMTPSGALSSTSFPSRNYSSLLSNSQNSSSQTVLDALRMSGLSTNRLDCTDLFQGLEEELKEFKSTKQRLLDIQASLSTGDDKKAASRRHKNNNSNILAKTKDLQEWIKKY